jgi:hypothetical protein
MAHFARKLRYGAHDGESGASYMALIQLAHEKSENRGSEFVLYRRIIQRDYPSESKTEMIRLQVATAHEAVKRFWPWDDGTGEEFPGHQSHLWEKTTLWLDLVAAGGSYERCGFESNRYGVRRGRWVKVGTPAPWSKRRKKKPLQFGLPAHIILVDRARIRGLEEEIDELGYQLNELESYDDESDSNYVPEENLAEYGSIEGKISLLAREIASIEAKIEALREKMRIQVRKMFPKPLGLIPKRVSRQKESWRSA